MIVADCELNGRKYVDARGAVLRQPRADHRRGHPGQGHRRGPPRRVRADPPRGGGPPRRARRRGRRERQRAEEDVARDGQPRAGVPETRLEARDPEAPPLGHAPHRDAARGQRAHTVPLARGNRGRDRRALPDRLKAPVTFIAATGSKERRREAFGLRWRNVDEAAGVIRLEAQETKTGKVRVLPYAEDPRLAELIAERRPRDRRMGPRALHPDALGVLARGDGRARPTRRGAEPGLLQGLDRSVRAGQGRGPAPTRPPPRVRPCRRARRPRRADDHAIGRMGQPLDF